MPTEKNAIGATIKRPEVKVNCSDCIYFERLASFKEPCKDLGILSGSKPCTRFTPDIFQVFSNDPDKPPALRKQGVRSGKNLNALDLVGQLPKADLQRFAALALAEARSRTRGYHAGQEVYVQVIGDSSDPYLNCFAKAWVLTTTKKHVLVRGQKAEFNGYYTLDSDSILTRVKWKKLKKRLIKSGKVDAPRSPKISRVQVDPKDHEPPAMGSAGQVKVKNGKVTLRNSKKSKK